MIEVDGLMAAIIPSPPAAAPSAGAPAEFAAALALAEHGSGGAGSGPLTDTPPMIGGGAGATVPAEADPATTPALILEALLGSGGPEVAQAALASVIEDVGDAAESVEVADPDPATVATGGDQLSPLSLAAVGAPSVPVPAHDRAAPLDATADVGAPAIDPVGAAVGDGRPGIDVPDTVVTPTNADVDQPTLAADSAVVSSEPRPDGGSPGGADAAVPVSGAPAAPAAAARPTTPVEAQHRTEGDDAAARAASVADAAEVSDAAEVPDAGAIASTAGRAPMEGSMQRSDGAAGEPVATGVATTPAESAESAVSTTMPARDAPDDVTRVAGAAPVDDPLPVADAPAPGAQPVVSAPAPARAETNVVGVVDGAPTPSAPPSETTPTQQVAEALREVRRLADGSHRLSLQLHPEELGAVQLEIAMRDGRLHVRAVAETEAARIALEQHLPELRSELRDAGVRAGSLEVGPDTSGRDRSAAASRDPQRPSGAPRDAEPPAPSTTQPSATSGLDIRL